MKATTANQIAEMKKQTFGVEVEMNNISRASAAAIAATYFGTGRFDYTADVNGYDTWSAWDAQGREWKMQKDVSICGPDEEKCEMVTPILHYDDMELLQELVRTLRHSNARSDASRGCGVHIHVGANGHDAQSLRNLSNIMAAHEEILTKALDLDHGRTTSYCRPVNRAFLKELNEKKPATMAELADIWYKSQDCDYCRDEHYNPSRYHMLNLHATFTKGTVEFRLFQFDTPRRAEGKKGGLHAGALKAYIQLCLAMSQMAKQLKNASPKVLETDNPKYAMRCWLLRLGFIGPEFATAREILTKKLEGNLVRRYSIPA